MNRTETRPSFLKEAGIGFCISAIAAAVAATGALVLPAPFVARLVVAGIGLSCVLRAMAGSDEKTGRVVTLVVWTALTLGAWAAGVGLPLFVALHAVLIWLLRSLFSYAHLIESGLDFALTVLAVSFGVWAGLRTDSVLLAAWCFLLVQALQVAVPGLARRLRRGPGRDTREIDAGRRFAEAYRAADEALRRIAARS